MTQLEAEFEAALYHGSVHYDHVTNDYSCRRAFHDRLVVWDGMFFFEFSGPVVLSVPKQFLPHILGVNPEVK